jgi:hypothetical protein
MLKLRSIGATIRCSKAGSASLATERMPCLWLWNVTIHLTGGLPMGSAKDLDTGKAWAALKARTPPSLLAAAYKAMNIRDDG